MNNKTIRLILAGMLTALTGCSDGAPPAEPAWEAVATPESPPASIFDEIPWTLDGLKKAYVTGTRLSYSRSGTDDDGAPVGGTHTFEVTEVGGQVVSIDSVWQDGGRKGTGFNQYEWEKAVFLESNPGASDTVFSVKGTETVVVPSGSFETVVVEVSNSFFRTRDTYWLIVDQPGVYAKWVEHGKEDAPANIVMELVDIELPDA